MTLRSGAKENVQDLKEIGCEAGRVAAGCWCDGFAQRLCFRLIGRVGWVKMSRSETNCFRNVSRYDSYCRSKIFLKCYLKDGYVYRLSCGMYYGNYTFDNLKIGDTP